MDETYHIGILLDGSGFTKVAQLRALALFSFTILHTTVQLRQGDDRDIQLLGQSFQRAGNRTHLFLTAAERHTAGIHQLKVVDDNNPYPMLANQTTGFGTKLEYGKRRSIVHIQRRIQQVTQFIVQLLPTVGRPTKNWTIRPRSTAVIQSITTVAFKVARPFPCTKPWQNLSTFQL